MSHGRNIICSVEPCNVSRMDENDLSTPGRRLKFARMKAGFDAKTFAKKVGMNPTTYRAYENDQNGYAKLALDFAERLGVEASWLLKGGSAPEVMREEVEAEKTAREMGLMLVPQLELGYSMGGGSVFSEYRQTGFVPFNREWLRTFARGNLNEMFVARGEGDSMTPTLLDGDIVLIDTGQKRIEQQDRIWALGYGELGMIKRVRRLPNGSYRLMSDNPSVPAIEASDEEMYVVGRVVWIGRRI